jgi:hypothetical protein
VLTVEERSGLAALARRRKAAQDLALRAGVRSPRRTATDSATVSSRLMPSRVDQAILRGIERGRFVIAPGTSVAPFARRRSLIGPLLHRFQFDPLIARLDRRFSTGAGAGTKRS